MRLRHVDNKPIGVNPSICDMDNISIVVLIDGLTAAELQANFQGFRLELLGRGKVAPLPLRILSLGKALDGHRLQAALSAAKAYMPAAPGPATLRLTYNGMTVITRPVASGGQLKSFNIAVIRCDAGGPS